MQGLIDELFEAIIQKLIKENYITFENYFLDGTKRMKQMLINIPLFGRKQLLSLRLN